MNLTCDEFDLSDVDSVDVDQDDLDDVHGPQDDDDTHDDNIETHGNRNRIGTNLGHKGEFNRINENGLCGTTPNTTIPQTLYLLQQASSSLFSRAHG